MMRGSRFRRIRAGAWAASTGITPDSAPRMPVPVPILVEQHEKVGLRRVAREAIVLAQKAEKLGRGPVVPERSRINALVQSHVLEQSFAFARALEVLTDVKIEHTQRAQLDVIRV
eukprot:scaffold9150_cov120-Isochrysis_galbana.AAC.13